MQYNRPYLELEYSHEAFVSSGCCRYVPIVLRLCGVPKHQNIILNVSFERMRKRSKDGQPLDEYEVDATRLAPLRTDFPNYCEYALELLARGHARETGTIRVSITSRAAHLITEVVIVFDCRAAEPVWKVCKGLKGYRLRRALRTAQERNALLGQFAGQALAAQRETTARTEQPTRLEITGLVRGSLFP